MAVLFARIIALSLIVTLVLTAETLAMARAAPAPVGEIILCTQHGVMAVPVDADGNPTEPAQICPDCASFFAGLHHAAALSCPWARLVPTVWPPVQPWADFAQPVSAALARAPPFQI